MTNTVKLFLDTEFTGLHKNTTLISLALVSEFDDIFYAEFNDYDKTQVDNWLQDNVITNLLFNHLSRHNLREFEKNELSREYIKNNKTIITKHLTRWFESISSIYNCSKFEIWSDCLAYDWVLFNDLFDNVFNLPKSIYYIPFDLATVFKLKCIDPDINREEFSEFKYTEVDKKHNALTDAKVIKACYEKIFPLSNIPNKYKLGNTSKLNAAQKPLE